MSEEQIALAKRAVACKGWRWMPGMLACDARFIRHRIQDDGSALDLSDDILNRAWGYSPDTLRPILTDHSTLGCLLALVRDAYVDHRIVARPDPEEEVWYVITQYGASWAGNEAEALVAALEAAP